MLVRHARAEDRQLLWDWDPMTQRFGRHRSRLTRFLGKLHASCFDARVQRPASSGSSRSVIFIAEDEEGTPLGQIRFDSRPDNDWEVDVSVARSMRGLGVASWLIEQGVRAVLEENPIAFVHAFVRPQNGASSKAFERAAFQRVGVERVRECEAIHLRYGRSELLDLWTNNSRIEEKKYLVLGCKPWNRSLFDETLRLLPGRWNYVTSPDDLSVELVRRTSPRIFFLHWSWKVPEQIVDRYECVCFHMTDVPFGRGGFLFKI